MKKIKITLSVMLLAFLVSCLKDESNLEYNEISDIGISGIAERYDVLSYAGEKLEITPAIASSYQDMEYEWYLLNPKGGTSASEETSEIIARTKDLSYEINLSEGSYTLVFKASSKANGYSVIKRVPLAVSMEFSRGFYILKKTLDGNTDIDFVSPENVLQANMLEKRQGSSMQGAPRTLSVCYGQSYMNGLVRDYANTISIVTESDIQFLRLSDMEKMFDFSNMFYGPKDADEVPYIAIRGYFATFYLSNKGLRYSYTNDMPGISSVGVFGVPAGSGGSKFFVQNYWTNGLVYWDEQGGNLMDSDESGSVYPLEVNPARDYQTQNLIGYKALFAGQNYTGGVENIFFLLEAPSGKRELYRINMDEGYPVLNQVTEISANKGLATANLFSIKGKDATLIYFVKDNKVYTYNFQTEANGIPNGTEQEVTLQGLPQGETITYISNQYWTHTPDLENNFDYLVVGTQNGNNYTLYMYETIGGLPNGSPVKTFSGEGEMTSIRYVSPVFSPRLDGAVIDYPRMD